ncbi:hypothetical protein FP742_21875 [Vibrio parahaemolyticus]|uniref:hypothetical protein n=1 Tax=Vibrio parahaemolyticus TaxID=670 RepID=UPI0011202005|nr:hypothetical protein [Vibrio parahaemolyticus]EGR1175702.1 hypothetical protein [Vibrio parahaemolyticus]MBE4159327.1 hypothetical protein [Vibrio parahaemolyticus]MBM5085591.1 hypothetical protein [Vibrio parahaemolyticus]MBM5151396.1 hypothetical protein [Vibrio parahaemolyticus]MBM5164993.1 hypothetical protein [Vibrio parahaemolyticus]
MRSRTQLVIDALEAEYKRLEKKAARYKAQQEMPLLAFLELQKEIQVKLSTLDAGTRAFSNYLRQADKKLSELKIEQAKYEKRDINKVMHHEAVCLEEMATIRSLIELEKMRAM